MLTFCAVLSLLFPVATGVPAQLFLLHDAPVTHGAKCLDGSPPGVYIRDTHPGNPWILAADGGGWCYNETDCYDRSLTALGSSNTWPSTRFGGGLEDDDCTNNPTFCGFNVAILPYCDGNSQLGNRTDPIIYSNATFSTPLYARGLAIFYAVMDFLMTNTSLAQAKEVLVDGCSAGGHSSYHHLDRIAALLPGAETRGVGDAGLFLDAQIVVGGQYSYSPGSFYYRSLLTYYFAMHNATAGVNAQCLAERPTELAWQCATGKEAVRYLQHPTFLVQSDFDQYQMLNHFAPPWVPGVDPTWVACSTVNASACTGEQLNAMVELWMVPFRGALAVAGALGSHVTPHGPHGIFLHSCIIHCQMGEMHTLAIDGTTMYTAISTWWTKSRGGGPDYQWVDCVGVNCNPTCG